MQSQLCDRANQSKSLSDVAPRTQSEVLSNFVLSGWLVGCRIFKVIAGNAVINATQFICLWWQGHSWGGDRVLGQGWWTDCLGMRTPRPCSRWLGIWGIRWRHERPYVKLQNRERVSVMVCMSASVKLECSLYPWKEIIVLCLSVSWMTFSVLSMLWLTFSVFWKLPHDKGRCEKINKTK